MTTTVVAKAIIKKTPVPKKVSSPPASTSPVRRGWNQTGCPGPVSGIATATSPSHSPTLRKVVSQPLDGAVPLWKRLLDILCIIISLPITLPTMLVVVLWIKLVSHGPALFHQERIGRNGKRFVLYKFRSMKRHADTSRHERHFSHLVRTDHPMVKLDLMCDSRLIPGGGFLRAAGLDELPQLLNVLRGEMSLVGPRPCLPEEFRFFTPQQRHRFETLPGLTGIWQVYGKGVATFNEMNAMDAQYVEQSSPALDLGIMMRTPYALVRQMREAYQQSRAAEATTHFGAAEDRAVSGYSTQRLV